MNQEQEVIKDEGAGDLVGVTVVETEVGKDKETEVQEINLLGDSKKVE